jgi:SAM-dependent MidA family methyltransferase
MGSGDTSGIGADEISSEFLTAFRAAVRPEEGMSFARFMELALYHPDAGYYRRPRPRVGTGPGTDFFTATSTGPIFGELVCAACVSLLGDSDPKEFTFVEIGAEPAQGSGSGGILGGLPHPFGGVRIVSLGEPIALTGPCVVFANELLDAQPFRRFVFRHGAWQELGVAFRENRLVEVELPITPSADGRFGDLAEKWEAVPDGYVIDAPIGAMVLLETIAAQPWKGLLVTFDYGKTWAELTTATPKGTARAYYQHQQETNLLARPGQQDLTCHVCWDWLREALARHRFDRIAVAAQEAFLIEHAGDFIAAMILAEAQTHSARKAGLMQLLHPAHLGQKFQVLSAFRE